MSLMNISGHTYATTSDREIWVQVMETESAKLTVGEVYSLRFVKKCGDVQPNQHFALAKLGSYVPCYVSSTIVWKERLPFGGGAVLPSHDAEYQHHHQASPHPGRC